MNCNEIEQKSAMYFSYELAAQESIDFLSHLESCASCAEAVEKQREVDNLVRTAVWNLQPNSRAVEARILAKIGSMAASPPPSWFLNWRRAAAFVAIIVVLAFGLVNLSVANQAELALYADAAVDHRVEVGNKAPMPWYSNLEEISRMSEPVLLGETIHLEALGPVGYRFDRARVCFLQGKSYLHIVYRDSGHEISVFVTHRDLGGISMVSSRFRRKVINAEAVTNISVASFRDRNLVFLVVGDQPKDVVYRLASQVSQKI